jgi:superfamily II DNA or RNA helicase
LRSGHATVNLRQAARYSLRRGISETRRLAARKANTLVLVHRRQLLDQWRERLASFLNLPIKSIGQIGGGRHRPNGMIDVAVIQSLNRKQVVDDLVANYGHVIVDECHHLSAVSFEQVFRQVKARRVKS